MTDQQIKAFRCMIPGLDLGGIVFARTAKRAKQRFYRIYKGHCALTEIKVRRTPEYDDRRPPDDSLDPGCWSENAIRRRAPATFGSRYDLTPDGRSPPADLRGHLAILHDRPVVLQPVQGRPTAGPQRPLRNATGGTGALGVPLQEALFTQ